MRKILGILLLVVCLGGCRGGMSEPEKAAWGFLHAYYSNDFQGALKYADQATREELESTLGQLQSDGVTAEQMRSVARPVIIEIEGIIANDGVQAICAYKLKNSTNDYNALMETLLLTRTDDGWKVSF